MAEKSKGNPFAFASVTHCNNCRAAKKEISKQLLQSQAGSTLGGVRRLNPAPSSDIRGNVVGLAVGEKISDGRRTGVMAVLYLVEHKFRISHLLANERIPKAISGVPTDVVEVGLIRRLAKKTSKATTAKTMTAAQTATAVLDAIPDPKVRIRPAAPGCSVGFADPNGQFVMAGTFGALVKDSAGHLMILSNNHVLADESRLAIGSPIYQPGLLDGGDTSTDQVASLTRFIPFKVKTPNTIDCAVATATKPELVTNQILHIGAPSGTADAAIDMMVHKFGRTTSYTVGHVTAIDADVTVKYDTGNFTFTDQILIESDDDSPFSKAGDSGSLIVERSSGKAVGLLFAGSPSHTIANHIGAVLKSLGVKLA